MDEVATINMQLQVRSPSSSVPLSLSQALQTKWREVNCPVVKFLNGCRHTCLPVAFEVDVFLTGRCCRFQVPTLSAAWL